MELQRQATPGKAKTGENGGHGDHGGNGGSAGDRSRASQTPPVYLTLSDTVAHFMRDAPTCPYCGHVAVRNGACFKCLNCGESLGCS